MSRVDLLERMYIKDITSSFDYDKIGAPPLYSLITPRDAQDLYQIATSLKYNGNIEKKYELIDQIMRYRGFRKAHAGTNRLVYNFLEYPYIVAKVAIDRVGINDSPAEFKNQNFFKPFCCKIHEVDPTGVIAIVERVNPISSLEEFISVAEDIYYLITSKIVGKYVLDDIGVTKFMNYGIRNGFGPVILDFPYAYELDGKKLICNKTIRTPYGEIPCGGEIDYDGGFDNLICAKCGRTYQAKDLQINNQNKILIMEGEESMMTRARILKGGKVLCDSAISTKQYVTKEQVKALSKPNQTVTEDGLVKVDKTTYKKSVPMKVRHERAIREADRQFKKINKLSATIKKVDSGYKEPNVPNGALVKVSEGDPSIFNPIKVPPINNSKKRKEESYYDKLVSQIDDGLISYYNLKKDKNGKIRKDGKFVAAQALKQMIEDYKQHLSELDELNQVEEPEDLSTDLNTNNSLDVEEENYYEGYEPADDQNPDNYEEDEDAIEYEEYVDKYVTDNKAAKRAQKAAKSKRRNNFDGMENY